MSAPRIYIKNRLNEMLELDEENLKDIKLEVGKLIVFTNSSPNEYCMGRLYKFIGMKIIANRQILRFEAVSRCGFTSSRSSQFEVVRLTETNEVALDQPFLPAIVTPTPENEKSSDNEPPVAAMLPHVPTEVLINMVNHRVVMPVSFNDILQEYRPELVPNATCRKSQYPPSIDKIEYNRMKMQRRT